VAATSAKGGPKYGQVWQESISESEAGDARAEEGQLEKRTVRQKSEKPQASNRDWTFAGSPRGRQGASQEIFIEEIQKEIAQLRVRTDY
jgi:hypothetical protein